MIGLSFASIYLEDALKTFSLFNMKNYEDLNPEEKAALLKFPAYISLLAAETVGILDITEKKHAIRLTHIKTFSCNPLLNSYWEDAEKVFESNLADLDYELPEDPNQRKAAIYTGLKKLEPILKSLGEEYAVIMRDGMKAYVRHVSYAHNNTIEYFLMPFDIPGFTE